MPRIFEVTFKLVLQDGDEDALREEFANSFEDDEDEDEDLSILEIVKQIAFASLSSELQYDGLPLTFDEDEPVTIVEK